MLPVSLYLLSHSIWMHLMHLDNSKALEIIAKSCMCECLIIFCMERWARMLPSAMQIKRAIFCGGIEGIQWA